jgi:DNA-nicking Smr family endonuclease
MSNRNGPPKKKDPEFHNSPFKDALKTLQKKPPEPAKGKTPPPPPPSKKKARAEEDDVSLFYAAMDGVQQITHRGEPPKVNPRLPEIIDENAEALAQLSELVAGQGEFDMADSDEFIEGATPGTDRNLLRALRRGDFSIQGRLDLHGMTQAEAKDAVDRFLTDSRRAKRRCVLIVHGRGLHSKDQLPVLKTWLKGWLSQKRIGSMVLAFSSARPQDGGAGAVYVLLRR